MENQICKKCGHHKVFHLKDNDNCVHGLIIKKDGLDYTNACTCKEFQSEEISDTIKDEMKEELHKDY